MHEAKTWRLFIAVPFPWRVQAALEENTALLRRSCVKGSFTRRENLHLTLAFLGETAPERLEELRAVLDGCAGAPLALSFGPLGRFKRPEGDILWRQVNAEEGLFRLQAALSAALTARGFPLEDRPFRPHLTLARRARLAPGESLEALSRQLPPLSFRAEQICLLRSELGGGAPVYMPLYRTKLGTGRVNSPGNNPAAR